jgi:hypothetical protein
MIGLVSADLATGKNGTVSVEITASGTIASFKVFLLDGAWAPVRGAGSLTTV